MNNPIKSIAILSGKGGTGKSLVTLSMGYTLYDIGLKVLLIDLDFFTNGLTYYAIGDKPYHLGIGLKQYIEDINYTPENITEIKLYQNINRNSLDLVSSFGENESHRNSTMFLNIKESADFTRKFNQLLTYYERYYDHIIIDTRGGADYTSIIAAQLCDGYIIMTEADKPSWDIGGKLLTTLRENVQNENLSAQKKGLPLGFVINKNVLPSEAIERFIKIEWRLQHLITIGLDLDAIKYFQEDKIPTNVDIFSDFSRGIIGLIRNSNLINHVNKKFSERFESIEGKIKRKKRKVELARLRENFSFVFKNYLLIMIIILLGLSIKTGFEFFSEFTLIVFLFISLMFVITTDGVFIRNVIKMYRIITKTYFN